MDLTKYIPRKQAVAADPRTARTAAPSAAPQPYAQPASQPAPPQLRVGLLPWLFGHGAKFAYRLVTATWVHDRPRSVTSTDPTEHGRMRRLSSLLWSVVIPLVTLVTAGPIAAAFVGLLGLFLLVRHRAAKESIAVTPASLFEDAKILVGASKPWRTIAFAAAAFAVSGVVTSVYLLSIGQLMVASGWILTLAFGFAAAVRGVEELEDTDLSTGFERSVLALGTGANRAVSKLRKAGKNVEVL